MENSLHFGIDKLSKQYEKIVALKFPQIPEDNLTYIFNNTDTAL